MSAHKWGKGLGWHFTLSACHQLLTLLTHKSRTFSSQFHPFPSRLKLPALTPLGTTFSLQTFPRIIHLPHEVCQIFTSATPDCSPSRPPVAINQLPPQSLPHKRFTGFRNPFLPYLAVYWTAARLDLEEERGAASKGE